MALYTDLLAFFQHLTPTWRKTQQVNLALLSRALYQRQSFVLTDLARAYPIPTTRKVAHPQHGLLHRVKRLVRFVANPRLDLDALMVRLTRLSYTVNRSPGLLLPVLVDLTYFGRFAVLSANVPRGGRALPIAWRIFRRDLAEEPERSQNQIIERLVEDVHARIVPTIQTVIVADREFAAARFFRFLAACPTHFVIRVDAETWVLHPHYTGPLASLRLHVGGPRIWLVGALYGQTEREPLNLLAVWARGQAEPWFVASNLTDPRLVERLDRKRMKIEHGYRDWKHHLRLKGTAHVHRATHLAGLVLAVVALYWYVCLLGQRLARSPLTPEVQAWGRLGDFKKGMELLALDSPLIARATARLLRWAGAKLGGLAPPTPRYRLRYLRYRRLPQSG